MVIFEVLVCGAVLLDRTMALLVSPCIAHKVNKILEILFFCERHNVLFIRPTLMQDEVI